MPDFEQHWNNRVISYPMYPTVRHRQRLVMARLRKIVDNPQTFSRGTGRIFDFGCGEGTTLARLLKRYHLQSNQISGNDPSHTALSAARQNLPASTLLHSDIYPALNRRYDVVICSEVIEHSQDYLEIIRWLGNALKPGGHLILTTQTGKRHGIDHYSGHTQHFSVKELQLLLKEQGIELIYSRRWGFPFFSTQKRIADLNFNFVQKNFLEYDVSILKKTFYGIVYGIYFLHDLIPIGPQLIMVGKKNI